MTVQSQITLKSLEHLAIFDAIHQKYHRNKDESLNVDLDLFPLSDQEKSLVVAAMSYKYTAILLQIGYLIRKSKTGVINVPAHFIAGHGENGAQCSEKTVDRFFAHTRDILIKCEDNYLRDEEGTWRRAPHKISFTKFGVEAYSILYTMFFGKYTRAIRKKGGWERKYQEQKKQLRPSFHKTKRALKDILAKEALNFYEGMNIVHNWYKKCMQWGRENLKTFHEQLRKKDVPSTVQKMSSHKEGNLFRKKKEENFFVNPKNFTFSLRI